MKFPKVMLLLLLLVAPSGFEAADNKEIKFKTRDLEKVKAEMNRKKEERERLRKEAEELSESVKTEKSQMKNVEQSLLNTRRRNVEVEQQMASTKNKHDALLNDLEYRRGELKSSLNQYYVASLLTGPNGPVTVFSGQAIRIKTDNVRELKTKSQDARQSLESLVETENLLRREVERQQSKLSDIQTGTRDKERLLTKKLTRQEILEAELRDLQHTSEELASLIDVLRTKQKSEETTEKQARLQKITAGQSPILPHSIPWPLKGKVTTKFGRQMHPTLGTPFISNGIIIDSEEAENLYAVSDGKVLYAGEFMSYGSMAVVEHPGDWYSVYGKMQGWLVEKGQEVKRGDQIGISRPKAGGGNEAYFELRFYGKPTDPLPWLAVEN